MIIDIIWKQIFVNKLDWTEDTDKFLQKFVNIKICQCPMWYECVKMICVAVAYIYGLQLYKLMVPNYNTI